MTKDDLSRIGREMAEDLDRTFPAYVQATADGVFGGSLRILGSRQDAEDVMQETYARAYRALQGYDPQRVRDLKVRAWTWTIAANLCRNRLRSRARQPTTSIIGVDVLSPSADEEALSGVGARLQASILDLPFNQRAAVVLRHVLDLSYQDVATALDRPLGTVKADIHRGLSRLRAQHTKEELQ